MDTMEWTKIFGSMCGSLLVFLLIQWGTESIYHDYHHSDHGEKDSAYEMVEKPQKIENNEIDEVPFLQLVANGDASKGKKVFGKCKSCPVYPLKS